MPTFDLSPDELTRLAHSEGFDLAGIAALEEQGSEQPGDYLEQWIAAGHAGEMDYLKRRNPQGELLRSKVQAAIPWARSVIVCAASYNAAGPLSIESRAGDHRLDRPLRLGWKDRHRQRRAPAVRLPRHAARPPARLGSHAPRPHRRSVRVALLRRYRPAHRARSRPPGRHRLDSQKHLHAQPAARVDALPLLHRHLARCRPSQPTGSCSRPLRHLPPLHRSVSHPGAGRARPDGRQPLHRLSHHREARPDPGRAPRPHRPPGLRLRHLPGGLPVEQKGKQADAGFQQHPSRADQSSALLARGPRSGRIQPAVSRIPDKAHKTQWLDAQRSHRNGEQWRTGISGSARSLGCKDEDTVLADAAAWALERIDSTK